MQPPVLSRERGRATRENFGSHRHAVLIFPPFFSLLFSAFDLCCHQPATKKAAPDADNGGASGGSILSRLKRRMVLLKQQVSCADRLPGLCARICDMLPLSECGTRSLTPIHCNAPPFLPSQLDASKSELDMSKEQYELDTFELSEENANLRQQVKSAKAAVARAEKTAAQSTAALERRKNT